MIHKLVDEGADAFRLNFSHGTHEEKTKLVNMVRMKIFINFFYYTNSSLLEFKGVQIRKVDSEENKPFAIVGDLQGLNFVLGDFPPERLSFYPVKDFGLI